MHKNKTWNRKKILAAFLILLAMMIGLCGRLAYLMLFDAEDYAGKAVRLHERERDIKAARGRIVDAAGVVLADNRPVCTVSVIHSQVKDPEGVIHMLTENLGMDEAVIRKKVEKVSSRELIRSNVDKETGDRIRAFHYEGVKVDEDYKRYYPLGELASKVLGFTGSDNQGIIGLEVAYESYLKGTAGQIRTLTDARGVEIENAAEARTEPVPGYDLYVSLDSNIQAYAQQAAEKVMEEKQAERVSVLLMNPQNGEIYAMVNVPEFDLNDPFTLSEETLDAHPSLTEKERQDLLNQMWRNACINDTYEPGSTFKVITASAGLEEGVVSTSDAFFCPGYKIVEDRRIRCHKVGGHGSENFIQGTMNSCNPVFMEVGLRLGPERMYDYFQKFGLLEKTGVDLPGEAGTIMHKKDAIGQVELATISFGQSFQITPLKLLTTVSSLVNGGRLVTPHLACSVKNRDGEVQQVFDWDTDRQILSEETSATMRMILEKVVSEGTGKNAYIEGYAIGGKTATSQTLPRSAHRYISSFVGFAPADDPIVAGLVVIHDPQGIYYGGTIAAPVLQEIFENILPYLGVACIQK